jgi:hypothetical protein
VNGGLGLREGEEGVGGALLRGRGYGSVDNLYKCRNLGGVNINYTPSVFICKAYPYEKSGAPFTKDTCWRRTGSV